MLIAATERGICSIQFARTDGELMEGLKREFPFASRKRDGNRDENRGDNDAEGGLQSWVSALLRHMEGKDLDSSSLLPLDIRATAFQRRVWTYLQSIPFGATRSYSQVAKGIGRPRAVRAVARACATNPVAVAIPCHRIVRQDGSMGGYRWGIERKKALLEMEQKNF
jgi:AraC family transcriptional regulator of adaptative response/methylated-DNA-[protein]-cysteine methyltransferase